MRRHCFSLSKFGAFIEELLITIDVTSSSAIAEGPRDALSQFKSCQRCTTVRKITFGYKDCPLWYKTITGRFFGLVTKHACDRRTDGQN